MSFYAPLPRHKRPNRWQRWRIKRSLRHWTDVRCEDALGYPIDDAAPHGMPWRGARVPRG